MIARAVLACVFVAAVAAPAHANDKRAAAAHFQKGRALFEQGSFAAALDEFNAGYDAYPLPGFLVNIGQCQRKLDRLDEAAASFQKFLDSDGADPKLRGEVQDALGEIAAERDRRAAVELEARRQRDEAERRQPVEEETPRTADLRAPQPLPAAAAPALATSSAPVAAVEQQPQKSRKWVWAVVGVLAVGVAASAVAVGVVESQPTPAKAGSLGLLDGRR